MPPENETAIIHAVLAGNTDAYAALVERYQVGLIIHCDRIVGGRDDAEDIAQKAFLKAYQQLATFEPLRSRFSTWLYRIATNLAIDLLRARKPTVSIDALQLPAPPDPALSEAQVARETRAAVASLKNPDQRRVIKAYYWEGKKYEEIASEMKVPVNTIKSWLRRAKQQLKEKLS